MLKHLLTVEAAFHFTVPMDGVIINPYLPADFIDKLKQKSYSATLFFSDGRRQAVNMLFFQAHYSRRTTGLPPGLWLFRNFRAPVTTLIRKER